MIKSDMIEFMDELKFELTFENDACQTNSDAPILISEFLRSEFLSCWTLAPLLSFMYT